VRDILKDAAGAPVSSHKTLAKGVTS